MKIVGFDILDWLKNQNYFGNIEQKTIYQFHDWWTHFNQQYTNKIGKVFFWFPKTLSKSQISKIASLRLWNLF